MFDRCDLFPYDSDDRKTQDCCALGWAEGCRPALPRHRPRSPRQNAAACCRPQSERRCPERNRDCYDSSYCREDPCRCDDWDPCIHPSACQRNPCNLPRGNWMPVCAPSRDDPCRRTWKRVKRCKRPHPCPPHPCPPQTRPFWIRKMDAETGAGLPCATFRLRGPDESLQVETSREDGWLCFEIRPCMRYVLAEISAPPGYEQNCLILEIIMDECGRVWVDGCMVECLCIPNVRLVD